MGHFLADFFKISEMHSLYSPVGVVVCSGDPDTPAAKRVNAAPQRVALRWGLVPPQPRVMLAVTERIPREDDVDRLQSLLQVANQHFCVWSLALALIFLQFVFLPRFMDDENAMLLLECLTIKFLKDACEDSILSSHVLDSVSLCIKNTLWLVEFPWGRKDLTFCDEERQGSVGMLYFHNKRKWNVVGCFCGVNSECGEFFFTFIYWKMLVFAFSIQWIWVGAGYLDRPDPEIVYFFIERLAWK